jgi:predicted dehydrogenase
MVGLGVISKFYVAALEKSKSATMTAACDLRAEALEPHRAKGRAVYLDYHELLADPNVDGVVINVPNDRHVDLCRDALLAGKHVLCEKPLALREDDANLLAHLARARGRVLFTAFHRRYNRHVLDAIERCRGRRITRLSVRYLEKIEEHSGADAWYLDPARCGGGCIADNGPNAFDVVCAVLGPVRVLECIVQRDGQGVDRRARVELVSAKGVPAHVELDWSFPGELKDLAIELQGGEIVHADMLDGFHEFKSSLWHEYEGVLDDFLARVRAGDHATEGGVEAVRLTAQAYALDCA